MRISCNDAVGRADRICVAVFAGGGYGYGAGCVCKVAKVPAKGDIFAGSDLVVGGGLEGGLGKNDLSRVPVSRNAADGLGCA